MAFVGANLFAKALFQTTNLLRLYWPFREQVRSYVWAWEPDGFCGSELVREGFVFNAKSSATVRALSRTSSLTFGHGSQMAFVGANLFAKALFRTTNLLRLYWPFREQVRLRLGMGAGWLLWERTCSRRHCFERQIFCDCTGPFANKFAPTFGHGSRMAFVVANLFAKALFSTPNLLRLYGPFREQVRSYVWA